ncbi:MAG: DNA polymerase Y family protein [Achromobacter sp.]
MRLWIALHLSRLLLDALRPPWPLDATACAVMDQGCVLALTPTAQRDGVRLGMRAGGVNAIAPHAILLDRDTAAEDQAREGAALAMLQYTPEVAYAPDNTLLMDVTASLMVFGGPHALSHRVAHSLRALGLTHAIGMAPTARGAWLLARHPRPAARRLVRLPQLRQRLQRYPLARVPEAQPRLDWLEGIGCRTIGDIQALPRASLQRRVGTALLHALDAACGLSPEVHAWVIAPETFERRIELNERLEHTDGVLHVACVLIEQLSGWLTQRRCAIQSMTLSMLHERGRHARPPTPLHLTLGEPAWQASHLIGLLRERLHRMVLEAPVIAIVVLADDTVPQPMASTTLFPEPGGTAADRARLLELLTARLGAERVRRPAPVADHRPEAANRWGEALSKPARMPDTTPGPLDPPFWLLDPPLPLQTRRHRPYYRAPLRLVRGPERIESGWWDPAMALRDYFIAEDPAHARYWIYRNRSAAHQDHDGDDGQWFLHGLYA